MVEQNLQDVIFTPVEYGVIKHAWMRHGDLRERTAFIKTVRQNVRTEVLHRAKIAAMSDGVFEPVEKVSVPYDQAELAISALRAYVQDTYRSEADTKYVPVADQILAEYDAQRREEILSPEVSRLTI